MINVSNDAEGKGFEFGAGDLAALTGPPKFKTIEAEREYLKIKLTAAMRIFDHLGYCHGVVRYVSSLIAYWNPF